MDFILKTGDWVHGILPGSIAWATLRLIAQMLIEWIRSAALL